jgi:hypothetical protein
MKIKLRNAWSATLVASIAILTVTAGIVAPSASAATPSKSAPKTCTFAHGHLGPSNYAIDSYTSRTLAWTDTDSAPGEPFSLERYRDTLSQCWQILNGFGDYRIEISNRKGLCITENPYTHDSGVPLVLESCLSKKTQLFYPYGSGGVRFELAGSPGLCVTSDTKIQAGAVLYQDTCHNSSVRQHWWINTSP